MTDTVALSRSRPLAFHLAPRLPYGLRLTVALAGIGGGMLLQVVMFHWFPGILLMLAGNALLLVKGCDNLLDASYDAHAQWSRVSVEQVAGISAMNRRLRRWDRSVFDFSNQLGAVLGLLFMVPAGFVFVNTAFEAQLLAIVSGDILALLAPHWFTGMRRILTFPELEIKLKCIRTLLADPAVKAVVDPQNVEYFVLLKGPEGRKVPGDVKFKIVIPGQHPDFLGFFGQVVINTVSSTMYPYFYCVLVAKAGYGLPSRVNLDEIKDCALVAGRRKKEDVEVLVIRQETTRTSGYETKRNSCRTILLTALEVARKSALKQASLPVNHG